MKKEFYLKKRIIAFAMVLSGLAHGQVGINTENPNASLDVSAKNPTGTSTATDGILIPRVDRQRAQNMAAVQTSTLIYVNNILTGSATGKAANINAVGFYSFDGSVWQKFGMGGSSTEYTGTAPVIVNNVTDMISVSNATNTTEGVIRLSGDLDHNDPTSPHVTGLQGIPVSTTAPTNGYVLTYNDSANKWEPAINTPGQTPVSIITTTNKSGGPYNNSAYIACTTANTWNSLRIHVNGIEVTRGEGVQNYKTSQSTFIPRGATWVAWATDNNPMSCVIMRW